MKSNKIIALSFVAFSALSLFSCDKKGDKDSTPTTKSILTSSQWKKSEYKENGVVKPFFGSCEMDDVITFTAGGQCIIDDATVVCSTTTSQTDGYYISADGKSMTWTYSQGEVIFSENNTKFTFKRTGANTFEYIFIKK